MSVKSGKDLKKGDIIYRIYKSSDGKWYYCIYELEKIHHYQKSDMLFITPIITYYEAKHSSVTTLIINKISDNWIDAWPHPWDYITTDENMAKCMYYEQTGIIK